MKQRKEQNKKIVFPCCGEAWVVITPALPETFRKACPICRAVSVFTVSEMRAERLPSAVTPDGRAERLLPDITPEELAASIENCQRLAFKYSSYL